MGLLMLAGLFGTIAYMGYYVKQETTAVTGDRLIQPNYIPYQDKKTIKNNFVLICKRNGVKLDIQGNPIDKDKYKQCMAYLQYQGFQEYAVNHFKKLYLEKYNERYKNQKEKIQKKHQDLRLYFYDEPHQIKIIRHWDYGDTQTKCEKMMKNSLWKYMVKSYNIVNDGISNVEVWTISAPPSVIEQVNTIYDEVCELEVYNKD